MSHREVWVAAGGAFAYAVIWTAIGWSNLGAASLAMGGAIWIATFFMGILTFAAVGVRRGRTTSGHTELRDRSKALAVLFGVLLAAAVFGALVFVHR